MSDRGGVRIATRASALARWQATYVQERLAGLGVRSTLVAIETDADRSSLPIAHLGVGVFTKAIQEALLDDRADVAVHSFKDLPSAVDPRLELAAVPERASAHDVLLVRRGFDVHAGALPLTRGARIGTGAARRRAQLLHVRPDLVVQPLRGNVPTRIAKLRAGEHDAIVLAAAGLERLEIDLEGLERFDLDTSVMVPAPAQGALALEIRRGDPLGDLLTDLHDVGGYPSVAAERGLMTMLAAGCQLALGAYARSVDGALELEAFYEDERVRVVHASAEGAAMLAFDALGRPARARAESAAPHDGAPS
ncbi:MAG: hydroxymethylbilane synthase [Trueperaceae bacterium]|nr:hydroxymethylbilane synthase [Trueperaceae bacterium]